MTRTWMVRAKEGGRLFDIFRDKSIIAIGWSMIGSLETLKTKEQITEKVTEVWPDWHPQRISMSVGQIYRFRSEIKNGDRIVTYDPGRRVYLVGNVIGNYRYDTGIAEDAPNIRDVEWKGEVPRDRLSVASKNSLGSISTLFLVPEEAAADIERALSSSEPKAVLGYHDESAGESELFADIEARAIEFIKDHVSRLDWEEMQELVAGLLRAMGYKTRVSPSGPDRGKDIVASPDGFGFESPRIVVEVKHQNQSIGAQHIRSFFGWPPSR